MALLTTDAVQNNLPVVLSSFVGRASELAELGELLEQERLVALTGAGGCGKTRLALQAATEALQRFPDGVWWVELAPLAQAKLVGAAIAESLGVRPLPGMTELQAAGAYLQSRRALVVFDNCEHLLEACAGAADSLLKAAPGLVVLATSRAPLGVDGEADWRVPPMSLPDLDAGPQREMGGSDAVTLFVERARKADPGFELTDENAEPVARICTGVDGLPLALELAAARLRVLSVRQIATELAHRFRLLTGGPRTAEPRLRTLRASVDWSHGLLSDEERVLLRRIAVFAGGFTLASVEQICAEDPLDRDRVIDVLGSLVDQSLVLAEPATERYRLLETVREYGLEQLAAAAEENTLRRRHRDAFLDLAEEAGPQLETARQREWLERLDPEAANLAAAIDHALRTEPALALRFCAALHMWWSTRGRFAEAELAQSRALEAFGDGDPALRARVLLGRAWTRNRAGAYEAAEAHATEALALADEAGDAGAAARARCQLGAAAAFVKPAAARVELKRAAELARAAGDDWAFVNAKQLIMTTYVFQSDHDEALAAGTEVAELAERIGDPFQVARRWLWPAYAAHLDGRLAEARNVLEQEWTALSAVGEPGMSGMAAQILALTDIWQGDPERALRRLDEQLQRILKLGVAAVVPLLHVGSALAELATGRYGEARVRLEGLLQLTEGRELVVTSQALVLLADARRLLADDDAEEVAVRAQATAEELGNHFLATWARLVLARLAAARGELASAQRHALAHLDACVEGGHATYIPGALDALAEIAAGLGSEKDAVRMLAAAERARTQIGSVRVPPEREYWAAMDARLREALGDEAYETARGEGAALTIEDALEWARRARGPRRRPAAGWGSLTPTEVRVAALVAEGLTNVQVGERMFVSKATVKTHLAHIFRKLGVHNRAELTAETTRRRT